jgi:hypothetical protein
MAISYSKLCRDTLLQRLADSSLGFNTRLTSSASSYGVTPYAIDFSGMSNNFFQVNADPDTIEEANSVSGNYAVLYTAGSSDQNNIKGMTFSGGVNLILRIHLLLKGSSLPVDTESIMDLTDEAVVSSVNDPLNYMFASPPRATWTGNIQTSRLPVTSSVKDYWRLGCVYVFPFELDT